jgi:hypothetical protein
MNTQIAISCRQVIGRKPHVSPCRQDTFLSGANMKRCPLLDISLLALSQGRYAIVDTMDYKWLNQWKWYAHWGGYGVWYVMRQKDMGEGRQTSLSLHRVILNAHAGVYVDHRNRDGLDNRRCNLRIATSSQNKANRVKAKRNTSGYKGVTWHRSSRKWQAQINHGCQKIYMGQYDDPLVAAKKYDEKAKEMFGEFALTNFQENQDADTRTR